MRNFVIWALGFVTGVAIGCLITKLYVMEHFVLISVSGIHPLVQ